MLKPNHIPQTQPEIRVGIVLPEDQVKQINLVLPEGEKYSIKHNNESIGLISKTRKLHFLASNNGIFSNNTVVEHVLISPENRQQVSSGSGVKVLNVVAGRGFHWQKQIDVTLPGKFEIRNVKGVLILINILPLESYLMCVATSEMGAECPPALIEAQTITARSWMLANVEQKHIALGMDVCNDDCCQRYQGTTYLTEQSITGALNTFGQVLMYDHKICDARYSKSCGGVMEVFEEVWAGEPHPYLQAIPDALTKIPDSALPLSDDNNAAAWLDHTPDCFCGPAYINESELSRYLGSVDDFGRYFRWKVDYSQEEITQLLNFSLGINAIAILQIIPMHRGKSGRIMRLAVRYLDAAGMEDVHLISTEYQIRNALHRGFLYSSFFYVIEGEFSNDIPLSFTLIGGGWGHGVGLCQIGALGMALAGHDVKKILSHYFPGSELKTLYSKND